MTEPGAARRAYKAALRSTYVSRDADECGRTYYLVDEDAADAALAEVEAALADFKSRHTAAGCGMDAATGSLTVMTTGVKP